jgi:hypothetical protein
VELYLHFPNKSLWRGAQLKHRSNFTFIFTFSRAIRNVTLCRVQFVSWVLIWVTSVVVNNTAYSSLCRERERERKAFRVWSLIENEYLNFRLCHKLGSVSCWKVTVAVKLNVIAYKTALSTLYNKKLRFQICCGRLIKYVELYQNHILWTSSILWTKHRWNFYEPDSICVGKEGYINCGAHYMKRSLTNMYRSRSEDVLQRSYEESWTLLLHNETNVHQKKNRYCQ